MYRQPHTVTVCAPGVGGQCLLCASVGIIVALLGKELKNGTFEVEDYTFAELPEQTDPDTMDTEEEEKSAHQLITICLPVGLWVVHTN